ncbi:histidine kinase [Tamlana nanhaiensis]|uniref:histidine kinase n=1 Tax=Neotamlana nanhaiensis TaxID=1382798 RepID=A0A0D7W2G4_9FLAO|nr:HAMP domain-containing sensor histidine kinase [Tamlana nanhaiensis]KJD33305.1 histidine kinase [Tamlana nanhaiensis]
MTGVNNDTFSVLFDAVSEGVIVVNTSQKIVEVNQSVLQLFGYEKDELINQSIEVLIPHRFHKNHSTYVSKFMDNKEKRQMGHGRDLYGARKDGSTFPLEIGLNPLEVEGESFVMAMVIDITVRKEQENKLKELNDELEKKVEERTKTLSITVNQLKEAQDETIKALKKEKELNELKTKFLSLVSHEFKTPLSGILTSTMLLAKYKLSEQQEKRDKHIKTISDKVHYLNNILNDFLSIEKLETGKIKYNFTSFKISKVVNEVIYNANMLLKEGQIINYPENIDDFSMFQDEKTLELALSNLVNNAIKYSPENTIVDITVKQDAVNTTFEVKDNGIGIPVEEQKNIFKRYFRAENALLTQGTGIGLNIVKSHLENLGGAISFTSEQDKGSKFTFTLPNEAKQ